VDDANHVLAYQRVLGNERAVAMFNVSEDFQDVTIEVDSGTYSEELFGSRVERAQGSLTVRLPPLGATVWVRVGD